MSASVQHITGIARIEEYLKAIGIAEATKKRIEEIHSYVQKIFPSKVEDIFIHALERN